MSFVCSWGLDELADINSITSFSVGKTRHQQVMMCLQASSKPIVTVS